MSKSLTRLASLLTLSAFAVSCQQEPTVDSVAIPSPEPLYGTLPATTYSAKTGKSADTLRVAIVMAEFITTAASDELVNTLLFNDRGNKQLSFDFAPGNSLDGTDDISYYIDGTRPSAEVPVAQSTAAFERAMQTWEEASCSELNMYQVPATGKTTGFVSLVFGYGGSSDYVADVVQNGWLPAAFFKRVFGNRGNSVLGVTFTLVQTDARGNYVDSNNDGKLDVAWREIYYNDRFNWATSIDIETVALHEAGHGLSQEHFGKAFRQTNTNEIQYSPRAVMNAIYSGIQTTVEGTDNAGHCSIWGNWPNK